MTGHIITADQIEITCTPPDGILTVSAETVGQLDLLALTMPRGDWRIDVHTATGAVLTARPATDRKAAT